MGGLAPWPACAGGHFPGGRTGDIGDVVPGPGDGFACHPGWDGAGAHRCWPVHIVAPRGEAARRCNDQDERCFIPKMMLGRPGESEPEREGNLTERGGNLKIVYILFVCPFVCPWKCVTLRKLHYVSQYHRVPGFLIRALKKTHAAYRLTLQNIYLRRTKTPLFHQQLHHLLPPIAAVAIRFCCASKKKHVLAVPRIPVLLFCSWVLVDFYEGARLGLL